MAPFGAAAGISASLRLRLRYAPIPAILRTPPPGTQAGTYSTRRASQALGARCSCKSASARAGGERGYLAWPAPNENPPRGRGPVSRRASQYGLLRRAKPRPAGSCRSGSQNAARSGALAPTVLLSWLFVETLYTPKHCFLSKCHRAAVEPRPSQGHLTNRPLRMCPPFLQSAHGTCRCFDITH